MQTVEQLLQAVPAFAGLVPEHLALIAGCATTTGATDDTLLFREGDAADAFFLLRRGVVALEAHAPSGPPLVVETLHAGDLVGWSWLVPPFRWHFDGRAIGDVRAIVFDAACLRAKADADAVLGYALLQRFAAIMVDRLQASRLRLLDLYGSGTAR